MFRTNLIAAILLHILLLCTFAEAQVTHQQVVPISGESGIVPVKSRWYRHVVMMTLPVMTASQATMGSPTGGGFPSAGMHGGSRRGFMYEAKLKNESGREVKAIHWDHVFLDPVKGTEMRRFHFFNDRSSIGKGKTATLSRMSGMPPSGVIDAGRLEKDSGPQYTERIDVRCVLYKGDVYWQAADATNAECGQLRRKLQKRNSK